MTDLSFSVNSGGFAQVFGAKGSQAQPVKPQPPVPSMNLGESAFQIFYFL